MSDMIPPVDGYIRKNKKWERELSELRRIIHRSELIEEVKWRVPCYTFEGSNVVFIGAFKDSAVISFVKGALLKDKHKVLIQQTKNSQSVRVMRFASVDDIKKAEPVLKAYIDEAIAAEKSGLKIDFKKTEDFEVPEEFLRQLERRPDVQAAFDALTPGRQRGYLLHFAGAKQSKTRAARVEKWIPQILDGKGLDD